MSHILDIIIKAQNQSTAAFKQVDNQMKNLKTNTNSYSNGYNQAWQSMSNSQQQNLIKMSTDAGTRMGRIKSSISNAAGKIKSTWKNMSSEMKTAIGAGLTAAGMYVTNFLRESVTATKEAEKGWIAYQNSLQVVTGRTVTDTSAMKQAVVDMANSTGRSTADVRQAMTNFMNKGLSLATSQKAAYAASGIAAAGLAKDEASASNMIIQAMNGRGMALKKLGININDYKDKVTGQIDTERLLNDITNKTKGAQEAYADSAEAVNNRLNNSIGSLKTSIGTIVLQVLEPLVNALTVVISVFNKMPQPLKTITAGLLMAFAGFALLLGPITTLLGLLQMLGVEITAVTILEKAQAVTTRIAAAAQWLWNAAMEANPIGILIIAITALIAALTYLYFNNEQVRNAMNALGSVLKGALKGAFETIQKVISRTVTFFGKLYNAFQIAISYANAMVNTIISKVKTLPDAIYNEFASIPGKIKASMSRAVSAAGSWGSSVVSHLKNAMGIHSPGFIQKAVVGEFNDTIDRIDGLTGKASKTSGAFGESLMGGFSLDTDLSRNSNLKVNQKLTIEHDFSNLPNGVSAEEVARIVNKTASSEAFGRTLAKNQTFQTADSSMKSRISRRNSRLGA